MTPDEDKPKNANDFKKLAIPILQRLAREASAKNPRRAAQAKECFSFVQALLGFAYGREQSCDARRAENLNLRGQIEALKGIVGERVVVAQHEESETVQGEDQGAQQ